MKRFIVTSLFALISTAALFASGVENKTNMSTGYLRNPSRNTEAKRPEASYYNIAGTAFLENGLHIEAGNQFVFKEYGNEMRTGNSLSSNGVNDYYSNDETTVWFYPDLDFVYKRGYFSFFGNFGVYAGGGSLEYSEGTSATTLLFAQAAKARPEAALPFIQAAKSHSLNVTSITYGGQMGGAYCFLDNLSLAFALRYVHGTQDMEIKSNAFLLLGNGSGKISYEANGYTISGVFGIHWRPIEIIDLALQYQSKSSVKYKVKDVKGNLAPSFGIRNGRTFHTDLPAALNLGAGLQAAKNLYLSASFNYYLNTFADQNSILGETDYDNSWEIAFGADWRIFKWLSYSAGIQYGKQGTKTDSNSTFNPVLDSFCFGTGIEIYPTERLTLSVAGLFAKYFDTNYYLDVFKTELSKSVTNLSFGVTYHIPTL